MSDDKDDLNRNLRNATAEIAEARVKCAIVEAELKTLSGSDCATLEKGSVALEGHITTLVLQQVSLSPLTRPRITLVVGTNCARQAAMSSGVTTTVSSWLLTGKLGALGNGTSRADVLSLLGEPEDWLADTRKETSSVWRYGAVELGFDDDGAVFYLQVDTVNLADPGSNTAIKLEWGPLCHEASLDECLRWLAKVGFDFDLRFDEDGASIYLSKSYLSFTGAEDPRLVNVASPAASQALRKARG